MAIFSQNLRIVSEREDSIDSIGAAYAPPTSGTTTVVDDSIIVSTDNSTAQQFPIGFGSYLDGILPADIATSAGTFAVTMQQVKNISSIPIEKFAQIVTNIETINGLTINGTTVPVDTTLVDGALPLIALGSGPYGTYTMSDFFGCMTGLPYIGIDILGLINALETPALYNIYKQLYLAVTWERATGVDVIYSTRPEESPPGVFTNYYTPTSLVLPTNLGGGYGRDGAPAPTITISNGGLGTTTIGTIDTELGTLLNAGSFVSGQVYQIVTVGTTNFTLIGAASNTIGVCFKATGIGSGTGTARLSNFGRVTSVSLAYSGPESIYIPTATVAYPPGGIETSPGVFIFDNNIVQTYIQAANDEISTIQSNNQRLSEQMNSNWNDTGTQLTIEQRALDTALPVAVPPIEVVTDLAQFPTTQYAFTDSVPQFALNTDPHMQAQSIEAIANICSPGGQSIVGMMREARNQARLTQIGITLDNNISDSVTPVENKTLLANGSINNTPPAKLGQVDCNTGDEVTANPYGFYDPVDNNYYVTNPVYLGLGGIGAGGNNTGNGWTGSGQVGGGSTPAVPTAVDVGNTGIYGGSLTGNNESTGLEGNGLTGNQGGAGGGVNGSNNGLLNGTSAVETGATTAFGSFAGSPYANIIPANLNVLYTSKNLLPSTYTIPEAIDEVIRCNCDCWDMI